MQELIQSVQAFGSPSIAVLGDLILDRYTWGNAERVSQEAPVILLRADYHEERPGGAASVAFLLASLGAQVSLAGVLGSDLWAEHLRALLRQAGIRHDAVLADSRRPTTVKERFIGRAQQRHPQQMLRVDYEVREALHSDLENGVLARFMPELEHAKAVLISDYNKGACTPRLVREVIATCRSRGTPVLVDPIRCPASSHWAHDRPTADHPFQKYAGATLLTPNRLEASLATGLPTDTVEEALQAAVVLLHCFDVQAAIVTLDRDGMVFAHRDGRRCHCPTRPRQVYDITGAGDMVLAVLGMALAAGTDLELAVRLANVAAGLEVEKIGVAPVRREEILADLQASAAASSPKDASHKVVSREQLLIEVARRRAQGQRLAFTNGCFDILHAGHVRYLYEARAQADMLVVALNSDRSVRELKGPTRPVQPQEARAQVLAALECVDLVTIFDEPTPLSLIQALRPDVLVKGGDYRREAIVGADWVEAHGGRVHIAAYHAGFSTTALLTKAQTLAPASLAQKKVA
ncbi:MAG: D-glycero-beta-D-manno-heptose 1-phosphate adenylyltransferase [Gemmataceae bacterium]